MNRRPTVLFLVHRVPYPPNRGDRIRSFHLLKFLARSANVHLATLADESLHPDTLAELQTHCDRISIEHVGKSRWLRGLQSLACGRSATEGLFKSPRLRRTIETWAREDRYDAVVVFCSSMVQYLDIAGLKDVPTMVDLVDVDSQKFLDYSATGRMPKKWLYALEGTRLRKVERTLPTRVEAITLVSEAEANLYRAFCPNDRTFAVGNGVDLEYFAPCDVEGRPNRCAFVGALDYPPNIDGVTWFCEHVWPRVRATCPDATFAIIGRNPAPSVRRLASMPGVEVVGAVPDVRPHVADASVIVVPLRIARGVQNKVLEALAMAKPVIASPAAIEGLLVKENVHALRASSVDEWLAGLERLFADAKARAQLGDFGRQLVEREYNWNEQLAPIDAWMATLGSNSPPDLISIPQASC